MTVSSKRNTTQHNYSLDGKALVRTDKVKYLGVHIDSKLSFSHHVEQKCKSATTILNMLRRNLYFAPVSVKTKAYLACVRPIMEYASSCWSPTTDKHNKMLEKVQNNAAKFALNKYPRKNHYEEFSVSKLIEELKWDSLEQRRNQAKLNTAFKNFM